MIQEHSTESYKLDIGGYEIDSIGPQHARRDGAHSFFAGHRFKQT